LAIASNNNDDNNNTTSERSDFTLESFGLTDALTSI